LREENKKKTADIPYDARFDLIRVVACLAVILLHVSARPLYLHMEGGASHAWWLIGISVSSMTHWCVPVFVMLSGALLLGRDLTWTDTYTRRLLRMFFVLVVATAIYAAWQIWFTKDFTTRSFLLSLYQGQPYYHLYFFYVVIGLYAISPLLSKLLANAEEPTTRACAIVACTISFVTFTATSFGGGYSQNAFNFFVPYIGYFALGHYLVRYRPALPFALIAAVAYVATIGAIEILALAFGPAWAFTLYPFTYFSPFVFAFSLGVFGLLLDVKVTDSAAKAIAIMAPLTLIAYIIHPMFMEFIRWVYTVKAPALATLKFDLALTFILTTALSFTVAYVLRQIPVVRRLF
jgi:surface polysaccharide O-acyltransferase-like enzyme